MRKIDAVQLAPRRSCAVGRERAGEVPHTVNGEDGGLFEGGDEKSSRQVRPVVLDAVELRPEISGPAADCRGELRLEPERLPLPSDAIENGAGGGKMGKDEPQPPEKVGAGIERDCHVVQIARADPCLIETIADRLRRKSGPMLDAVEAF